MMRHVPARPARRRARRALAIVCAMIVLAATAISARLLRGPIPLDLLRPRLERALAPPGSHFAIRLGSTALEWSVARRRVEVAAQDVHLLTTSGDPLASMQTFSVRLGIRALLRGVIEPREIAIEQPTLHLQRRPDGTIVFGSGSPAVGGPAVSLPELMSDLLADTGPLTSLRRLVVRDATVLIVEDAGHVGRVRTDSFEIRRKPDALVARARATLVLDDLVIPLKSKACVRRSGGYVDVSIRGVDSAALLPRLAHVDPATASRLATWISNTTLALTGNVRIVFDPALTPVVARIWVDAGPGTLASPALPTAIDVAGVHLVATIKADHVVLETLSVDLGGPVATVAATMTDPSGSATIAGDVRVTELSIDAVRRYWPPDLAPKTRAWLLANVTQGRIHDAHARIRARSTDGAVTFEDVAATFAYDGVTVRLLDPMSPVTGVRGHATCTGERLELRFTAGTLRGLTLTSAHVGITGLDARTSGPRLAAEATAQGSLTSTLTVLDEPPFGYARAMSVTPSAIAGRMTGTLRLAFPLDANRRKTRPTVAVNARLQDVGIPESVTGWPIRRGDLTLVMKDQVLRVDGTATLESAPVHIGLEQQLATGVRRVEVRGRIDAAQRAALGVDTRPWLDGPVDVKAAIVQARDGTGTVDVDADLRTAVLAIDALDVTKEPGKPGSVTARAVLQSGKVGSIERFTLTAAGAAVRGRATRRADAWRTIDLDATLPSVPQHGRSPDLTLEVRPDTGRGHPFTLRSRDAGVLIEALSPYADAQGGHLVVEGTVDLGAPGWPIDAHATVRDFVLTRWPALTRLATLVSLSGIDSALRGTGVPFDQLSVDIRHRGGLVTIRDGALTGSALRMVIDGTVDWAKDAVDLTGTLIPSYYVLNTLPGHIPVVGRLAGGSHGVHAFDFRITGRPGDPHVSASALSSVAPGILRDLMRHLR